MSPIHPLIASVLTSANIDPSSSSLSGNVLTTPSGSRYYAKTSPTAQITAELDSLRAMSHSAPEGFIPRIFGSKEDGPASAMVSEYFDLGGSTTQKELASSLAQMHRYGPRGAAGRFGFDVPTFCGATEQDNTWEVSWEVFFRDRRLGDLVRRLKDQEISTEWERLREGAVPLLLHDLHPQPVILHGDLWSGNAGLNRSTGRAVVFDPSSYYGHNEAELGIMRMFGGFTDEFFDTYHLIHPRSEPYYDERVKLYELYHHLNHTLIFGGGYKAGALKIMRSLITWAQSVRKP